MMKHIVPVVLLGAATMLAASALAQTATKPPAKPATAAKPAAVTQAAGKAKPKPHPTIIPRRAVFVPPPPVIELDEIAVVADLPTVLDNESRDAYRRIFQAQAAGQFGQAEADIGRLRDKTLMGYVDAQRLLSPGHTASYEQLAAWLQEYNDHPDAPAIYKLALAAVSLAVPSRRRRASSASPAIAQFRRLAHRNRRHSRAPPSFAPACGPWPTTAANAAFAPFDRKSTIDVSPQEGTGANLFAAPTPSNHLPLERRRRLKMHATWRTRRRLDGNNAAELGPSTRCLRSTWRAPPVAGNPRSSAPFCRRAARRTSTA
jgi:hypothetical protein